MGLMAWLRTSHITALVTLSFLVTQGYTLKCQIYQCKGTSSENTNCPIEMNECPVGKDHCIYQRLVLKQADGSKQYADVGSCASQVECDNDICQKANTSECTQTCCQKNLCNAREPTPTEPSLPSGGGVTCFKCDIMTINGVVNETTCTKPKKVKCSKTQDRCIRVKMTLVNVLGTIIPEDHGCESAQYCDNVCVNANITEGGKLTACERKCCLGDLCNIDQPSSGGTCFGIDGYCTSFGLMAMMFLLLSI